ncbi:alpha-amylase/4-alpha-glucanotransferase domain-containing protein [Dechloromonas sp. H13]|uniref:alpha-amylase/4-alpha-glucanotransferase domain-containing protein n=1 Tax=Dechloromonas sp. H13 TaxID=2570193 RepID=UPI001291B715|nr:alpha-amylase/4-alpha-glucanotransferase domain-containing protein [Dechloromonas sp. H13]
MNQPVTLLLGVHAHQPVGNFPEVIEDAHQRCYKPFIETLHAYPDFRFAAHFSGWLLDWLRERHPADMDRLAAMVRRGQVELFSSGDTEPVLAAIPQRDRIGQLRTLNDKLAAWTGVRPQGAWLTERVWESSVVAALAATGIRYVTVDDYHFFCTGKTADELDGYFSTEDDGTRLDLFPISEALRYRLPFSPAHEVVGYLEGLAEQGHAAAVYFDDIEKFGIWPETYDWVYNRGWLRALIEGVLASPLIRTATYADFHARQNTRGIVYLPTTSYSEMNEWTLPMPAAAAYTNLLAGEKAAGRGDLHRPFVRGGIWRNFLTRYPEANWMHKRMQALSARLAALPAAAAELTADLYRAQANDAYWHGLFGGLYLPHLRRAVWRNLVALEAGLDALQPRPPLVAVDLDFDGKTEILTHSGQLQVALRDDGLGAAHELLSYPLAHNFGDTLRRYHEHYHDRIGNAPSEHHGEGIASAHDIVRFKHPVSADDIVPDILPRALWLDELDGAAIADYRAAPAAPEFTRPGLVKTFALDGSTATVAWHCRGLAGRRMTTRLNLAMPSCDGFLGRYVLADGSIPGGFGQPLDLVAANALTLEDGVLGGHVLLHTPNSARIAGRPQQTVSQSEAGFEKIMQAVEVSITWTVPADDCTLRLQLTIAPSET